MIPQLETCWPKDSPGGGIVALARVKTEPEEARFATLRARFLASTDRKEKEEILDFLCSWPTPAAGLVLRDMVVEPVGSRSRDAGVDDAIWRTGVARAWDDWMVWCANQFELWKAEEPAVRALVEQQCAGLLLILYSQLPQTDSAVFDSLLQNLCGSTPRLELSGLVRSWSQSISLVERQALLGAIEAVPPLIAPPIIASFTPAVPAEPLREIPVDSEPPAPPKPSLWERHIQPLFVEELVHRRWDRDGDFWEFTAGLLHLGQALAGALHDHAGIAGVFHLVAGGNRPMDREESQRV